MSYGASFIDAWRQAGVCQPCQMMHAMVYPTSGLPRCLGLWAETKRRNEKPWPKSERPNGEHGTKVSRLAKETASRRIR
jgi:hypothetical protein